MRFEKTIQQTRTLVLAMLVISLNACGEEYDVNEKALAYEPSPTDLQSSALLEVKAGELVEFAGSNENPRDISPQSAWLGQAAAQNISTGQSVWIQIQTATNEIPLAWAVPSGINGDVDLYLYDKLGALISSAIKSSGYVDRLIPSSLASGTYYFRYYCYSGPCAFTPWVAKSDSNMFVSWAPYDNQRSYTTKSGKCVISTPQADGECYCADSSAAMNIVAGGKRKINEQRAAASDLFATANGIDGASDRTKLSKALTTSYGYTSCDYATTSLLTTINSALRSGKLVIFRSKALSSYGHYVAIVGIDVSARRLLVHDPYGKWASLTKWDPRNSTDASSANGAYLWLSFDTIAATDAGIISCQ